MDRPEVIIEKEDIEKVESFAEKVAPETYNRFNKSMPTRIERIFFGKLGEVIYNKYLNSIGVFPDVKGMFEIYPGTNNVDKFDFYTKDGKKIDVKAAYKSFHSRILVPYDQFEDGRAKDFYVGIKIILEDMKATIYGFAEKEVLERNGKHDFGEGLAYWEVLYKLNDIHLLDSKIK